MKNSLKIDFYIGLLLTILCTYLILDKTRVFAYGFSFGKPNPIAIITLLLMFCLVVYVISRNKIMLYIVVALIFGLIISIVMGLRFYMVSVSMLEALMMFGGLAIGIGLTLRSILMNK